MEAEGDRPSAQDIDSVCSSVISSLFMGQKERRRSSDAKPLLGDLLKLDGNTAVTKVISKTGDTKVLFSDEVVKINKRMKSQKRVLMITDKAIYNLDPDKFKVNRRIDIQDLGSFKLSCLTDNFFIFSVPKEYDYLMVSSRKCEVVTVLCQAYKNLTGNDLPVTFSNVLEYQPEEHVFREIRFANTDGGVTVQVYAKKG